MRNIISFIIILLFHSSLAQNTSLDNETELFDGIKFDNVDLGDIMITKGDLTQMRSLFGNSIVEEQNETAPFLAKDLYNDKLFFGFEDDTETGKDYYLAFIKVNSPSVVVKVKNLTISLGDDKTKFDLYPYNQNSKSFNFVDKDTGSASLSFEIDENTNKVSAIKFILF